MKIALLLAVLLSICSFTLGSDRPGSLINAQSQFAHSGGTDKCGCHRNSKTGDYHCHTRKKRGGDCPPAIKAEADESPEEQSDNTREVGTRMA